MSNNLIKDVSVCRPKRPSKCRSCGKPIQCDILGIKMKGQRGFNDLWFHWSCWNQIVSKVDRQQRMVTNDN